MILPAQTIRALSSITPLHPRTVSNGMTYGLSSAGYDVRIAQSIFLWPKGHALASTIEHFDMPLDLLGLVADKSSWARRFITVQNTVIEPGWRGFLTLELTNHTWWPCRIPAGSPIAQILFVRLEAVTELPYTGRYQDQGPGPVGAREAVFP